MSRCFKKPPKTPPPSLTVESFGKQNYLTSWIHYKNISPCRYGLARKTGPTTWILVALLSAHIYITFSKEYNSTHFYK